MCIMAMIWNAHPRWRLVLIGNRDEFHERPAAPVARWADTPGVIAGRDLRSGGTWLGVSEEGRAAIVTNLRGFGAPDPACASRGALVTDLLTGNGRYGDARTAALDDFNPFNLILIEGPRARFLTNRPDPLVTDLMPGLYGLSNGALDAPWPKTLALKAALLDWMNRGADTAETLLETLARRTLPEAGIVPSAPSDIADEAAASPIFIRHSIYGTRCSSVVAIDKKGRGMIAERRFDAQGGTLGESRIDFVWPG